MNSEQPISESFRRLHVFLFGVMPSETWRASITFWFMIVLSVILLLVSHAIRHWNWHPGGVNASVLATASTTFSIVLLLLATVGRAIAQARQLMAPSIKKDNLV